jgi:type II secretory pathway pseudopilin PulG
MVNCSARRSPRQSRAGFSLLETLIAFAVLIGAFTVFFRLYHSALNYSSRTEREVIAANVAQRQLVKLRGWSSAPSGGGLGFDDWSKYADVTFDDEEYPEYKVRIRSAFTPVISPSSELIDGVDQKTFESTFRKVQITVSWLQGSFEIVSLVADPTRQLRDVDPVLVDGVAGTVPMDGTVPFTIKVFDTSGREIPDMMVHWYVKPIDGTGQISSDVEGTTATFVNVSEKMDKTPQYTGGSCRVTARVSYRGQEVWGESGVLVLEN